MKAIVVEKPGSSSALQCKTDVPQPSVAKNEILVKVSHVGINYIDVYQRSGQFPVSMPFIPGCEGAGTVEKLGPNVTDLKVGDKVGFLCQGGAYAEYVSVSDAMAIKVEDVECGAAILLQGMTAVHLNSLVDVSSKWVLVYAAAGGTGSLICQVAKHRGASVIGVVSSEAKAEKIRNFVKHVIVGYDKVEKEVQRITNGGVHAVFDSVGKDTFEMSLAIARTGGIGHVIYFGAASGPPKPLDDFFSLHGTFITGASLFDAIGTKEGFEKLATDTLKLLKEKKIQCAIHKVYSLNDVKQAHEDISSRATTGKLLLKVD
jgi:NADPH2:quinone reductase